MKQVIVCLMLGLLFAFANDSRAKDIIDLSACDLKVTEIREIEGFKGEKGDMIKPSRRNAKFVELKLEGTANAEGESAWYPKMFAAVFEYRGSLKISPAVALGLKFSDKASGSKREQWFSEPEVSFTMKNKMGESFAHYLIIEIPEESKDFHLQGPAAIQQVQLDK